VEAARLPAGSVPFMYWTSHFMMRDPVRGWRPASPRRPITINTASPPGRYILQEMKRPALHSRNVLLSLAAADLVCAALPKANQIRRGQVAVITGGSSGLGLAIAHKLGKAGLRFETALSINFFGALHTIYAVMPHFLRRGEARSETPLLSAEKFRSPPVISKCLYCPALLSAERTRQRWTQTRIRRGRVSLPYSHPVALCVFRNGALPWCPPD
jgi:hypothetical protein